MGACGEEKTKKTQDKIQTTNDINIEHKIEINPIDEKTNDKLKSTPAVVKSYTIKFLNKNQETNKIIYGNLTINQILTDMKLRENSDYIIEFDNNLKIGAEKKDEKYLIIIYQK